MKNLKITFFVAFAFVFLPLRLIADPIVEQDSDFLKSQRIGLAGGTYDPPHRGHESVLINAMEKLSLDHIIMVPNFIPGHKPNASAFPIRQELSQLAMFYHPKVKVATADMAVEFNELGFANALNSLAERFPEKEFFLIVGGDVFSHPWPAGFRYKKNVGIIVQSRSKDENFPLEVNGTRIFAIEGQLVDISSTKIRRMLNEGTEPSAEVLEPKVFKKISDEGFYGFGNSCRSALKNAG